MEVSLVSHINGDGDLLEAWFQYYVRLGVTSFHLVLHGPPEQNRILFGIKDRYRVIIEDIYDGPFDSVEKCRRLNALLSRMPNRWILIVDSDEFVEFPYRTAGMTARMMKIAGHSALAAPMLQHLCPGGTLETPPLINDPFSLMPLCSVNLYEQMGVQACITKYPLLYSTGSTTLRDGGNHNCPFGSVLSSLQGVTHHFKFRTAVTGRLHARIESTHPWRHESVGFRNYLDANGGRLPTEGAFLYSRKQLFKRGLLKRATLKSGVNYLRGRFGRNRRDEVLATDKYSAEKK